MAFKLASKRRFTWSITVKMPADKGQFVAETFKATFEQLTTDRFTEILNDPESMKGPGTNIGAVVREVLVGWEDVRDEDGAEIPFSEEAREAMIQNQPALQALFLAYSKSQNAPAATKN